MTDVTSHRMVATGPVGRAADPFSPPAPIARKPRTLPSKLRRLFARSLLFLLLGAAATVAVAIALGLFVDVSLGKTQTADTWTGRHQWIVTRWDRIGATCIQSVRESAANWSPGQAIGPPNTPTTGGDQVTAWASATTDAQEEWLLLEYAGPVVPRAVRIYETCSTGAVAKVCVFTPDGKEVDAWSGTDPSPPGRGLALSEIPLHTSKATRRLKIYLDSRRFPGWNEIDAVGLVDGSDTVHWAIGADASSTYASSRTGLSVAGGGPDALAPAWSGLRTPGPEFTNLRVQREGRAVEARGWPMLALWGNVRSTQSAMPNPAGGTLLTGGASAPGGGGSTAISFVLTGGTTAPGPTPGQPPLLLRPVWPGVLVNSFFYAIVLGMLYWALTVPRRFVRELGRMRRGCCVACGYDLGFDFAPGCPECGWRRGSVTGRPAL
jgi:hypothetical protein